MQKGAVTIAELGDPLPAGARRAALQAANCRGISARSRPVTSSPSSGATASLTSPAPMSRSSTTSSAIAPIRRTVRLAVLSKMMNLAEAWGLRLDGSNPCRHVKKYREDKRERYLTKEELQRLGRGTWPTPSGTKTESPVCYLPLSAC